MCLYWNLSVYTQPIKVYVSLGFDLGSSSLLVLILSCAEIINNVARFTSCNSAMDVMRGGEGFAD